VLDASGHDVFASNMKTISARVLMLIAEANGLNVLTGDIGNAYLYAKNSMDVAVKLGMDFHLYDDSIPNGELARVEQALYGCQVSAHQWHAYLADSLLSMGFKPTRFDPDVWIRHDKRTNLYEYIGTHTDDLLVCSKDAKGIFDHLVKTYTIKSIAEPEFHLGCDYRKIDGKWHIGTKTYVSECLKKVGIIMGKANPASEHCNLGVEPTPMSTDLEPEVDESEFLDAEGHRKFQQLIGIAQWLVVSGRMDINFAVCSLSRFSSAPRKNHLKEAVRIFKYLNKFPERWIRIDPSDHKTMGDAKLDDPYKLEDKKSWIRLYPDVTEEIDPKAPKALTAPLTTAVYFDSNWAHDKVTRRSVSGIIGFIGQTPVSWYSKRQGAIATSTYSAELMAGRSGAEEAISLRYLLKSLGVKLSGRTLLIGDNLGSLLSTTNPGAECKKRHVNIAYHYIREAQAAEILSVYKIHTDWNPADFNTKALDKGKFLGFCDFLFHRYKDNKLQVRH
jgi:hypothetical protein